MYWSIVMGNPSELAERMHDGKGKLERICILESYRILGLHRQASFLSLLICFSAA